MSTRPPILVLTGATAVGKTDVALALAEREAVDIVSLDSAMVYRGLDIGTAKPAPETLRRYPHALVDIRDPSVPYSVADFLIDADAAVERAYARGRRPLLVGGTMLYLKAFLFGLSAAPGADPAVRARLRQQAAEQGWPALYETLAALDPVAAAGIHPHNGARIERALEVHELTGRPLSSFWRDDSARDAPTRHETEVEVFAIAPSDRAALHERIRRRCEAMFAAGLVEEVAALKGRGDLSEALPAIRAVGYRQVWAHLEGRETLDNTREKVAAATRQLAKRQFTWLKSLRPPSLTWGEPEQLAEEVLARSGVGDLPAP